MNQNFVNNPVNFNSSSQQLFHSNNKINIQNSNGFVNVKNPFLPNSNNSNSISNNFSNLSNDNIDSTDRANIAAGRNNINNTVAFNIQTSNKSTFSVNSLQTSQNYGKSPFNDNFILSNTNNYSQLNSI